MVQAKTKKGLHNTVRTITPTQRSLHDPPPFVSQHVIDIEALKEEVNYKRSILLKRFVNFKMLYVCVDLFLR